MLKFIQLKNKLINKYDILYIDVNYEDNSLVIIVKSGDKFIVKENTRAELIVDLDYIENNSKDVLFKLNSSSLINLDKIAVIEFVIDTLNSKEVLLAYVTWNVGINLPSVFVLDNKINYNDIMNRINER